MKKSAFVLALFVCSSSAMATTSSVNLPELEWLPTERLSVPSHHSQSQLDLDARAYHEADEFDFPEAEQDLREYHLEGLKLASPDAAYALAVMDLESAQMSPAIFHLLLADRFGSDKAAPVLEQLLPLLSESALSQIENAVEEFVASQLLVAPQKAEKNYETRQTRLTRIAPNGYSISLTERRRPIIYSFPFAFVVAPDGRIAEAWTPPDLQQRIERRAQDEYERFRYEEGDQYTIQFSEIHFQTGIDDVVDALNTFTTPAQNGHRPSQRAVAELTRTLAILDEEALDIPEMLKPSRSMGWFELAARQNFEGAQARLGIGYGRIEWTLFLFQHGSSELKRQSAISILLRLNDSEYRQPVIDYLQRHLEQNPNDELVQAILEQEVE
ncbi:hypothetical protein [Aliidiomarina sp. B3213]|nr:hypothetical protein [Aliidiomarina sp. B3213]RTE86729.1 hypothetical protein DQX04_09280 [Aliidiomarina sp. B3213]